MDVLLPGKWFEGVSAWGFFNMAGRQLRNSSQFRVRWYASTNRLWTCLKNGVSWLFVINSYTYLLLIGKVTSHPAIFPLLKGFAPCRCSIYKLKQQLKDLNLFKNDGLPKLSWTAVRLLFELAFSTPKDIWDRSSNLAVWQYLTMMAKMNTSWT